MLQFLHPIVLKSKCILYLPLTFRHILNYRTAQQSAVRLNSMRADACLFINKEEEGPVERREDILFCSTFSLVFSTYLKQSEAHLPSPGETPELGLHLKLKENKRRWVWCQDTPRRGESRCCFSFFPPKTKSGNERGEESLLIRRVLRFYHSILFALIWLSIMAEG